LEKKKLNNKKNGLRNKLPKLIIILCLCKVQKLPTPYKNARMKMTHRKILQYKLSSLLTAGSRAKKIKTLDFSFQVRPK
jgi:hypothetical protein